MTSNLPLWMQRFAFEQAVRDFFHRHQYVETRTPLLVKSPGLEPHIRPLEIKRQADQSPVFLPTSPEFSMKKLLARGFARIFQIAPAFRDEPDSPDHSPEFTLLEFYEAGIDLESLQARVESLFQSLALASRNSLQIEFRGKTVDLTGPWQKIRVPDLFKEHLDLDLRTHLSPESLVPFCIRNGIQADTHESWDDLYFKLWLNLIEPKLPANRPVFVTHYPLSQSSLCNSVLDETGFAWANRFEVYIGNFELGNAFDELRNAEKQRNNFLHDQKVRREVYGSTYPESPIDEEFLSAIEEMKPTCGIALGLDRMAMLILGANHIREVIPLASFW